jgi:energy-coupling factor transporter ATP-binding protein EcfA2
MITKVDIANLRSFEGEWSCELAPITLVYGPNSSGKSTLIKALGLLKQTLGPAGVFSAAERPPLVLEGPIVDFGTFTNAIHKHERDRPLYLGLQFADQPDTNAGELIYAGLGFEYDESAPGGAIQTVAELGGGDIRIRFGRPRATTKFRLDGTDQLLAMLERHIDPSEPHAQLALTELREKLDRDAGLEFLSSGFFPALPDAGYLANPESDKSFGTWFEGTAYRRVGALDELLGRLSYVGPVRAAPARFQSLPSGDADTTHVGAHGEHATRVLEQNRDGIRDRLNDWLRHLDIPYSLAVHKLPSDAAGTDIGDLVATALIDRAGTAISPQDVGFGISQLLPVIVETLANTSSTICIEQPEIHIHPRLQGNFADLVLESASTRRNQLIIETHSENLILRLLRRLRNESDPWLTPDKIAIIYVAAGDDGRAQLTQISITEDGDFNKEWPDGFFDERYDDLFDDPSPISPPGLPLPPPAQT